MNKDHQLPQDIAHRIRLLDVLDRITQVSLASENIEAMMSGVLDLVLEIFGADRAWFLYPCDPDANSWGVPMERTRPEWPGLFVQGVEVPMDTLYLNYSATCSVPMARSNIARVPITLYLS